MNKTYASVGAMLILMGCVSNNIWAESEPLVKEKTTPKSERFIDINVGEKWRMTCGGGSGAMEVPIFARVKRVSNSTGKVDIVITDRDGYEGAASAVVSQKHITMFGVRGPWDINGRSAKIDVPDICPDGMLIARL